MALAHSQSVISEGMWGEMALGTLRGMRGDGLGSVMALTSNEGRWHLGDCRDTVRGHGRRWHWFFPSKERCEWDKGSWFPRSSGRQEGTVLLGAC